MAVVSVDDRGRMTIPKELGIKSSKAVVIPAGTFFVTVPIPPRPLEVAGAWLDTKKTAKELKTMAEGKAKLDALRRAKRRGQP